MKKEPKKEDNMRQKLNVRKEATKKVKGFITQRSVKDSLPGGRVLIKNIFYVAKRIARLENEYVQNHDIVSVLSSVKSQSCTKYLHLDYLTG